MGVRVQFENKDRTAKSETYGPFDFAQLAGDDLCVGPDGDVFAKLHGGVWEFAPAVEAARHKWTDVIVFGVSESDDS